MTTTATETTTLPRVLAEANVDHLLKLARAAASAERVNEREWTKPASLSNTARTERAREEARSALTDALLSLVDYDLEVCDVCAGTYRATDQTDRSENCPGGHCANDECRCVACPHS
jgi:hypothetical protein